MKTVGRLDGDWGPNATSSLSPLPDQDSTASALIFVISLITVILNELSTGLKTSVSYTNRNIFGIALSSMLI